MPVQYGWVVPGPANYTNMTPSATNCTDGVHWIWVAMNDCVTNWQGQASVYLGLLSMFTWMVVGIPQMVKNCRNLNGMEGVSFFLLAQWFAGDVTNLVGSILTQQLEIQVYIAIYYVISDVILLLQYLAYICQKHKQQGKDTDSLVQPILCVSGLFMFSSMSIVKAVLPWSGAQMESQPFQHHVSGRSLLSVDVGKAVFTNPVDETGYAIGIVSSLFYIGSRVAQIRRNFTLKSTEGLSKVMFVLAVLGNLLYGIAIIVRSVDGVFLIRHLPWIVGSLGVIVLDVAILLQFRYYEQRNFDSLSRAPLIIDQVINVDPATDT